VIAIKVIYFDYGGSHSSVVAANIHAGKLAPPKTTPIGEIINLPILIKQLQMTSVK